MLMPAERESNPHHRPPGQQDDFGLSRPSFHSQKTIDRFA